MSSARDQSDILRTELETLIDTDKNAFNDVMDAFALAKGSDEEVAARDTAIEDANKIAATVPFTVMEKCLDALKQAKIVADKGNENSITDAGVAGLIGLAGVEGADYNVRINLTSINDKSFVADLRAKAEKVRTEAKEVADQIRKQVESKL